MILVAAVAVSLGMTRGTFPLITPWAFRSIDGIILVNQAFWPWPLALTIACLAIRLRKPRPGFHQLSGQPGLVACESLLVFGSISFPVTAIYQMQIQPSRPLGALQMVLVQFFQTFAGFIVIVAWGFLALSGRWRREPGWIDGMGMALGFYAIVLSILTSYYFE
jgi:hypothetical protein